jgi:hypothetical protein
MRQDQDFSRRRARSTSPRVESLEPRGLLTGGAGSLFAVMPANFAAPGATVELPFTIARDEFHAPHTTFQLGVDLSSQTGSPMIISVDHTNGRMLHKAQHTQYDPSVSAKLGGKTTTSGAIVPVAVGTRPTTYDLRIVGDGQKDGGANVGFYLPGDANGDGVVTQSDINTIKADMGSKYGDSKFSLDADPDRDGVINRNDLRIAQRNLGVSTTVLPTAVIHPQTGAVDAHNQSVSGSKLTYIGNATPNATVTFQNQQVPGSPPVAGAADASGNVSVTTPLSAGWNVFKVTIKDEFGQEISGVQLPVQYRPTS